MGAYNKKAEFTRKTLVILGLWFGVLFGVRILLGFWT